MSVKNHGKEVLHMLLALFGKKSHFRLHDLEMDFLTSKMTFNHQNSTINELYGENLTKMKYYICF